MTIQMYRRALHTLLWITAWFLVGGAPAYAWNSNINFCFPTTYSAPVIDGSITDTSWNYASRYIYDQGTLIPDLQMLGNSYNDSLNLSFVVNHDSTWSPGDMAMIAFEVGGARKALLFLLGQANGSSIVPNFFTYNSSTNSWNSDTVPAATAASAQYITSNGGTWTLEVRVPMAAYGIPAHGNFGFYANVLPVEPDLYTDHPWPPGTSEIHGTFNPTTLEGLPPTSEWGQGTTTALATACGGVSISSSDIYVTNANNSTPGNMIATNVANTFHAIVRNNSTNINGTAVAASNITARFKLAQFGISSNWIDAPHTGHSTPNPTGPATIPANGNADQTMQWTLNPAEAALYNTDATRHQCIQVELDHSGPSTTTFTNRVAQVNMDFGLASRYSSQPQIDLRGLPSLTGQRTSQNLILRTSQRIDTLDRNFVQNWLNRRVGDSTNSIITMGNDINTDRYSWDRLKTFDKFPIGAGKEFDNLVATLKKPSTQTSQLTYMIHGCRLTGKTAEINYHKYQRCEDVGAFGYIVRHAGIGAPKWNIAMDGPGISKMAGTAERYQLIVGSEQTAPISFSAEAVDDGNTECVPTTCKPCPNIKLGSSDGSEFPGAIVLIGCIGGLGGIVFRKRRKDEKGQVE